jgi:hypothetical protein
MPTVSLTRRLVFAAIALVAVAGLATAAYAAHPSGSGSTGSASCSESPNPVRVGGIYTISGSHLPANQIVNVQVSDAKGAQVVTVMTTSTGTLIATGQASVAGSYTVTIGGGGRKGGSLATCGFQAA